MNNKLTTLYTLSFAELVERFAFNGILTVLVLKLNQVFHLGDEMSYTIYGLFIALSYALLIFSGYLSDKMLGTKNTIIFGAIFLIIGNLLASSTAYYTFYLAISLIIIGTATFKVGCTSYVGTIYKGMEKQKKAFTFFYVCMNIGGLISPIIYGILITSTGWKISFILSAILIAISLFFILRNLESKENDIKPLKSKKMGLTFISAVIVSLVISVGFKFINIAQTVSDILLISCLVFLLILPFKQTILQKKHFFAIIFINIASALFFAFSFQVASSITLFIQRNIHILIENWKIPTSAYSSLNALFVVVTAPLFAFLWSRLHKIKKEPSIMLKIAMGIFLASFCFAIFSIIARSNLHESRWEIISYILIANFALGAGEACFAPFTLSAISEFSPRNLKSTLLGSWFFAVAVGGYLAGQLSKITDFNKKGVYISYQKTFHIMFLFAVLVSVVVFSLNPFVKKLLQKRGE